jgi:hypothetical protein
LVENDEETKGLLGMLGRALSKSKDSFRFETESVEEKGPLPQPEVETATLSVSPEIAEPTVKSVASELPRTAQPSLGNPRKLSVERVQELILRALRQITNFPERGVALTVYGFRPWNAMLNFAPGSTSYSEAAVFRKALAEIVDELRAQVEVDIDHGD